MAELFTNKAQTTLNGAITNVASSMIVNSATGFPTTGNFHVLLRAEGANADEIVTVTAVSGTAFTISRATEAVTGVQAASAHGNGAFVSHVLTAGALTTLMPVTPDLGTAQLLTRRAAVNTEDDHFDTGSLDAKWLAYTGSDVTVNTTDLLGWVHCTTTGVKLQAVPAGDWTIEVEVLVADYLAGAFGGGGLIVTSGTTLASASDARWGIDGNNSLAGIRYVAEKFVNGGFSSTYGSGNFTTLTNHYFLRINKTGTTYRFDASTNPKTFMAFVSTSSLGFTPTHFGFNSSRAGYYFNYFLRY